MGWNPIKPESHTVGAAEKGFPALRLIAMATMRSFGSHRLFTTRKLPPDRGSNFNDQLEQATTLGK